jgi:[NiFe] hydrogenase assembly HybE family chaperone
MNARAPVSSDALVERFMIIHETRMRDLPFVNQALLVEAVGFRPLGEHQLGVLITPWFMNLVILPAVDISARFPSGSKISIRFPSGPVEFTAACDEELGTFLTAVLFSSIGDIPDQDTAREIAQEVMLEVSNKAHGERTVSRRNLFAAVEVSNA